jgi:hypothetical protein
MVSAHEEPAAREALLIPGCEPKELKSTPAIYNQGKR